MEDTYEADVVYIDNDEWYTTKTELRQQPSAGFRKAAALVTYRNDAVESQEILKEEVIVEAIPKIVERGTKVPPTYIKPISGGGFPLALAAEKHQRRERPRIIRELTGQPPSVRRSWHPAAGTVTRAGWGQRLWLRRLHSACGWQRNPLRTLEQGFGQRWTEGQPGAENCPERKHGPKHRTAPAF